MSTANITENSLLQILLHLLDNTFDRKRISAYIPSPNVTLTLTLIQWRN